MSAPILRLARITHADAGPCACCDAPAIAWYRTGVIADGRIVVAAAGEAETLQRLAALANGGAS